MGIKKYAVVFPYQDTLKNVLAYIRSKKRDVWDFAEDDVIEFVGEDVMLNVYFLREGIGDFTRFENIMWYTPNSPALGGCRCLPPSCRVQLLF